MTRRRSAVVWLNGRFLQASRARVSALDRGLLYGDGIFDTVRAYDGRPFALEAHLRRLRRTGRRLGLVFPDDASVWERRIVELLRRNHLEDAAVRLTLTRGSGGEGLLPPKRIRPTLLLTARGLDPAFAALQKTGVSVVLLPFHPGLAGLLAGQKTVDYLTAMIGKKMARRRGAFEGIYTAPSGEVFEGTTSNLFLVIGRTLLTPPLRSGVLPGITRALVMRLAREAGLTVRERRLFRADLGRAREAFLTASTIEIMPIRQIDGRRIAATVGPVTGRIQKLFRSQR